MGVLRILWRIFFARRTRTARYDYTPPAGDGPLQGMPLQPVRLTRQHLVTIAVSAGATVSGKCWVIDGDTIDIGGKRIRLAGIDAPELDHPYRKAAKSAMIRLCQGQVVRAEFDGASSYERSMATCYLPDGRDLSAEMVRAGLAIDWPKYSGGKYAELEAEGLRRKLWRCDARQKGRMPPLKPGQD